MLDSRVLISVAQTGRTLADSLKRESGFNIDVFLDKALRYVGGTRAAARAALSGADADAAMDDDRSTTADWDWHKLGRTAMKYSRRAPTMDVLWVHQLVLLCAQRLVVLTACAASGRLRRSSRSAT